jgi:hypothetical protein
VQHTCVVRAFADSERVGKFGAMSRMIHGMGDTWDDGERHSGQMKMVERSRLEASYEAMLAVDQWISGGMDMRAQPRQHLQALMQLEQGIAPRYV